MYEKMYKLSEAAKLLNVHPETVRRWEKNGLISATRVGRGWRMFPESEINRIKNGE